LARDSQSSGDPVAAENYYQHAEHYFRLIAAAQEQFRQNNPHLPRPDNDTREESFGDDGDDEFGQQPMSNAPFGTREPQPFLPPEAQPYPQHNNQHVPRPHQQQGGGHDGGGQNDRQQADRPQGDRQQGDRQPHVDRLPSFITGGQQPGGQPQQGQQPQGLNNQNGHDGQSDRFPLHRRRRRHRGPPRPDLGGAPNIGDDGGDASPGGE
jgi:hypothetical protein